MTLSPGSRLAHYDIVAELGAGGMGAVYRARDSKLNRDVAIKVLLAAVAGDAGRLAQRQQTPDGKEMFFDRGGTLWAVDLTGTVPGGVFKAGIPQRLFSGLQRLHPHHYDVDPGGRRFLVLSTRALQDGAASVVVVLNWMTGLWQ